MLNYYDANGKSRFGEVEQYGTLSTDDNDTKQSSSKIKIKAEIGMAGLFNAGVEWIKEKTNPAPIIKETEIMGDNQSGDCAKIGSSGYGAQIGSSGDCAQIGSSGDGAQIGSSGDSDKIESTGEDSVVCCAGYNCTARASIGSWITLSEWKYSDDKKRYVPVCVKTEYVDGERIKADTWYRLVDGEFKAEE